MYTGLQNILAMRWSLENSYKVQKSRITVQPAVFPSTPRAQLFLSRLMSVQPGSRLSSLNPNSNSSASISSTYFASCIYVILFDRRRFMALTFPSLRCHNKNNSYRARSILTHTTTCRMYVCASQFGISHAKSRMSHTAAHPVYLTHPHFNFHTQQADAISKSVCVINLCVH